MSDATDPNGCVFWILLAGAAIIVIGEWLFTTAPGIACLFLLVLLYYYATREEEPNDNDNKHT